MRALALALLLMGCVETQVVVPLGDIYILEKLPPQKDLAIGQDTKSHDVRRCAKHSPDDDCWGYWNAGH